MSSAIEILTPSVIPLLKQVTSLDLVSGGWRLLLQGCHWAIEMSHFRCDRFYHRFSVSWPFFSTLIDLWLLIDASNYNLIHSHSIFTPLYKLQAISWPSEVLSSNIMWLESFQKTKKSLSEEPRFHKHRLHPGSTVSSNFPWKMIADSIRLSLFPNDFLEIIETRRAFNGKRL